MMYKIQTNASGTRTMEISENNLETIREYALFQDLIDSNGIVVEDNLYKLKMNVRSLMESQESVDKNLMNLCFEVIYHDNMKAYGLYQLVVLYINWLRTVEVNDSDRIC